MTLVMYLIMLIIWLLLSLIISIIMLACGYEIDFNDKSETALIFIGILFPPFWIGWGLIWWIHGAPKRTLKKLFQEENTWELFRFGNESPLAQAALGDKFKDSDEVEEAYRKHEPMLSKIDYCKLALGIHKTKGQVIDRVLSWREKGTAARQVTPKESLEKWIEAGRHWE